MAATALPLSQTGQRLIIMDLRVTEVILAQGSNPMAHKCHSRATIHIGKEDKGRPGRQMVTGYQMGPGFDSRVDEFISLSSDGICGRIWHINNAYHRSHIMGCRASIQASFFISFHLFRSFCICLSIAEKQ